MAELDLLLTGGRLSSGVLLGVHKRAMCVFAFVTGKRVECDNVGAAGHSMGRDLTFRKTRRSCLNVQGPN